MLEKYLQEIGLSDKEALIYLALLATDNASVVQLAGKTKIKRPTAYVILESLAKKGLVSETTIGKKTHYQAEPPERLETFVERQKVVLDERSRRLKDIIPQIKSVQRESGERPVVKYFEGREGVISAASEMFEGSLTPEEKMYLIYPKDLLNELFTQEELNQQRSRRLNNKIKSRVLYTFNSGELSSDDTGERLKIDSSKYPITCDIAVYKDRVRIGILGKSLSAVFIRSKDFAQTIRSLVDLIYEQKKGPR